MNVKGTFMTMIPGITIQKNAEGRITHITIDVAQQQELAQPVLEKLAGEKSKFRQDFEKGLTLEEVKNSAYHIIDQLFDANGKS